LLGTAKLKNMQLPTVFIEKSSSTGLYVGWVPGMPGAHSQGATLEELSDNLKEVIEMLLEEGTSSSFKEVEQPD
jgi:predicted RNase H-like HicB family nuclease